MKTLSVVFWILAALLSDVMCAVVVWNYCYLKWNGMLSSAPPSTAFLLGIPFLVGVAVCVLLALHFGKKA